eukprot:scaffold56780_cov62-Phaeocystis_antarctica.AAC.7
MPRLLLPLLLRPRAWAVQRPHRLSERVDQRLVQVEHEVQPPLLQVLLSRLPQGWSRGTHCAARSRRAPSSRSLVRLRRCETGDETQSAESLESRVTGGGPLVTSSLRFLAPAGSGGRRLFTCAGARAICGEEWGRWRGCEGQAVAARFWECGPHPSLAERVSVQELTGKSLRPVTVIFRARALTQDPPNLLPGSD